jgi:hypothetical protein
VAPRRSGRGTPFDLGSYLGSCVPIPPWGCKHGSGSRRGVDVMSRSPDKRAATRMEGLMIDRRRSTVANFPLGMRAAAGICPDSMRFEGCSVNGRRFATVMSLRHYTVRSTSIRGGSLSVSVCQFELLFPRYRRNVSRYRPRATEEICDLHACRKAFDVARLHKGCPKMPV